MPRFLRLKLDGKPTIHLGNDDPETGGYVSLCGKSLTGKISAHEVTAYQGDECPRCRKKAEGQWKSVGGKPVPGEMDWPGATRLPRGTKIQVPILRKKSN